MKLLLSIMTFIAFTGFSYADKPLKVKSKNYTCSELNELVQEEGTVLIKWIGSLYVHSSASVCRRNYEEAYQTTWRTKDKRYCVAGYSCRRLPDGN